MVYSAASITRATPLLKVLIVVLLIGVVISLFSGLVFLFKDADRSDSKRTWYALGVRVTLATALLITIAYGFYSGQLRMGSNAPWHGASGPDKQPDRQHNQAAPVD
jgi:NADH:ubiquinone oxidoreductase subunit 6 (subunit J)